MSLEQVKGFYQKLATDETFRTQIQGVKNKEECSQIVKTAGFTFTQQEFEEYTTQILEADPSESELQDLNDKELEAVFGGLKTLPPYVFPPDGWVHPMYGVIIGPIYPSDELVKPMYGHSRYPVAEP